MKLVLVLLAAAIVFVIVTAKTMTEAIITFIVLVGLFCLSPIGGWVMALTHLTGEVVSIKHQEFGPEPGFGHGGWQEIGLIVGKGPLDVSFSILGLTEGKPGSMMPLDGPKPFKVAAEKWQQHLTGLFVSAIIGAIIATVVLAQIK